MCSKWISGIQQETDMVYLNRSIRITFLCSKCETLIMENENIGNIPLFIQLGVHFYEFCQFNPSGFTTFRFYCLEKSKAIELNKKIDEIFVRNFFSSELLSFIDSKTSAQ